jgi:hypothetical protein
MTTKKCFAGITDLIFRLRKMRAARKIRGIMFVDIGVNLWLREAVITCQPEIQAWTDCRVVHTWPQAAKGITIQIREARR